ncbi:MAG: response regulator transcription factor [Opitutaceae bacterium]|nr:response regulator transcription factor [Opitutaceae bacterium]
MRVVIVEDHIMFREAIHKICEQECGVTVVGSATTGQEAAKLIGDARPDVVLLDLNLPDGDGFWVIERIKGASPKTKILVLSSHCDDYTLYRVARSEVQGFVDKSTQTAASLREALAALCRGQTYFSAAYLEAKENRRTDPLAFMKLLTDREFEMLALIGEGLTNAEIGRRMQLTPKTIETHRSNIMRKLDLHSTPKLIHFALESGLLQVPAKRGQQKVYC